MENNTVKNGTKFLAKDEVRFWLIIIAIIISAIASYFAQEGRIAMNTYRLDEIDKARVEIWEKQDKLNATQTALLQQLNTNMEIILSVYKKNSVIK